MLANRGIDLEVIVLDDASSDDTAQVVRALAAEDPRVRLEQAPPLPPGWCGKQHACWHLARLARHERLVWMDADVRLTRDALRRMTAHQHATGVDLISGFPRQVSGSLVESLVVPSIHLVLVGYLPMAISRRRQRSTPLAAGCGQLFLTRRDAYFYLGAQGQFGAHTAIRDSLHDGVTLPRAYRRHGLTTDIFDATDVAACRMYRSGAAVWSGLSRNATEGLATPIGLWVWSVLLGGGFVLPWLLAAAWGFDEGVRPVLTWLPRWLVDGVPLGATLRRGLVDLTPQQAWLLTSATAVSLATSLAVMGRFGQPWAAGLLRPVGVALLLVIQWRAYVQRLLGHRPTWRGRSYEAAAA